jgi:hypothetical protein
MPFLLGCFAVVFPRIALFLVWLLGNGFLERTYKSFLWIVLGFIFLPLTTLVFAYVSQSMPGNTAGVSPLGWLLTAIAVLLDIGLVGRGHSGYRGRRRVVEIEE